MPIEVFCETCQKKFRVPDNAAGKRIKCPKCQGVLQVPGTASGPGSSLAPLSGSSSNPAIPTPSKLAASQSSSGPIPTPKFTTPAKSGLSSKITRPQAPVENWHVQTEDGQQYGPVTRAELDQWYAEGRITADTQLLLEGSPQWQWATDVFPDLLPQQTPAVASGGIPDFGAMAGGGASAAGSGQFNFGAASGSGATTAARGRTTSGGRGRGKKKGSPHIDYIAYCNYAMGALILMCSLGIFLSGASLAAYISGQDVKGAVEASNWLGNLFFISALIMSFMSLPTLIAGYGLQQRAHWGRILALVLAIIGALSLSPLSIGLAIWSWIVLTDKENVAVFR